MAMQCRRWMASVVNLAVVLMAAQVQRSTQLRRNHPMHEAVDQVNARGGPYVGLVMAFPLEENALISSGCFVASDLFPSILIAGRRFNIGTIRGVNVIYVMTGEQIINAGITTQMLYDTFDILGVVHYGIAGSTNNSLLVGDITIPSHFAFTSSWDWQESRSSKAAGTTLSFDDYNVPKEGNNLLGEIEFTRVQLLSSSSTASSEKIRMEKLFWLPVDPTWFGIAMQLKATEVLQRCINKTNYCLPKAPNAAFGLKGSTADVYLNNAAYRGFLWEKLNISSVDEESAAIVMTSLSNGKPCLVFRGISDYAGGTGVKTKLMLKNRATNLAAMNALNLAIEFIELLGDYKSGFIE